MNTDHAEPKDLEVLRAAFDVDRRAAPLGWDAVRAFESLHGIVLPEPYRTFVAEICNGYKDGPPGYGLISLEGMPGSWGEGRPERDLAQPFPLTESWYWETDPEFDDEDLLDPIHNHGSIVLGTDGCGLNWHLIVAGPHRGHMWEISGEGALAFGAPPFGFTDADPGFAGWVKHWAAKKPWWNND
ncbi:SMI1/KNR4 family protein [Rhizohabitans arisaemae]|uniref:SMI1/KNR4 family protein n=1 Tax=Rhizohabitans arisaemae TaxID=2720610 RepID=UPI0024B243D2|nr:SMI1/KNR4 family protein [Rhizohabitans arisaemae]